MLCMGRSRRVWLDRWEGVRWKVVQSQLSSRSLQLITYNSGLYVLPVDFSFSISFEASLQPVEDSPTNSTLVVQLLSKDGPGDWSTLCSLSTNADPTTESSITLTCISGDSATFSWAGTGSVEFINQGIEMDLTTEDDNMAGIYYPHVGDGCWEMNWGLEMLYDGPWDRLRRWLLYTQDGTELDLVSTILATG
jgi:hypothetical protein